MPRARLGQHWLADKRVCKRIADAVALSPDETCIEIGGGKGALTKFLAPACRRLIVYEVDPKWAAHLRDQSETWEGDIEVREADALKIDWSRQHLGLEENEPLVVTGNLPYYITSPLLLRLAYSRLDMKKAVFLIQREVARRITSKPGDSDYSRLTVSLGAFLESRSLFSVPPDAFKPPPEVTSALIEMKPLEKPPVPVDLTDTFEHVVQIAFRMRRKTIKNNIRSGFPDLPASEIEDFLGSIGMNPNARPQEISVTQYVTLAKTLDLPKNG